MESNNTIAVAMSGGVDSSAVAALLRAEGHNVIGLTLQLWNQRRLAGREGMPESVQGRCCSIDDVYDARRVAEQRERARHCAEDALFCTISKLSSAVKDAFASSPKTKSAARE